MGEILVVDDDSEVLTATANTLRRHGYDPVITQSPEEALRLLKENPNRFEAILLDWKLRCPIDGDMIVKLVKHVFPDFKTPFIFITAHNIASSYLMRLGAYEILVKPLVAQQLIDAIKRALNKNPPDDPHLKAPSELTWRQHKRHDLVIRLTNAISSTRSITEAADSLGVSRRHLYRLLQKSGLHHFVVEKEL